MLCPKKRKGKENEYNFWCNREKMKETSSTFTLTEIYQQPATWEKTCKQIAEHKDEIRKFIDLVITQDDFDVILTGAGTSEFVGNALFPHLTQLLNYKAKSLRYNRYCSDTGGLPVPDEADASYQLRAFRKFTGVCRRCGCGRSCM